MGSFQGVDKVSITTYANKHEYVKRYIIVEFMAKFFLEAPIATNCGGGIAQETKDVFPALSFACA